MTEKWKILCKRTEDPKLAWIQTRLAELGIPSRRNGSSWHASHVLEVPSDQAQAAWDFLGSQWKHTRFTVDDIRDDHPDFIGSVEPEPEPYEDEMGDLRRAALNYRGEP